MALLFTDLVGFSSWALKAGDAATLLLLRDVGTVLESAVLGHQGRIVKRLGDGVMATFLDAPAAVDAALDAQDALREVEVDGYRPRMRAGVHWGRPRKLGGDYLGVDVNIAARVGDAAKADQLLASDTVLAAARRHGSELRAAQALCGPTAPRASSTSPLYRGPRPPGRLDGLGRVPATARFHAARRRGMPPDVAACYLERRLSPPLAQAKPGAHADRQRRLKRAMLSLRRPYTRVVCVLLAGLLACAAAVWLMSHSSAARAASTGQLQQQISQGQSRISSLSGALSATSSHLAQLNRSIAQSARLGSHGSRPILTPSAPSC